VSNKQFVILVAVLVALLGGPPAARALSDAVGDITDVELTVPAARTKLTAITPTTGSFAGGYDTVTIANSLTSCIRVGGPTLTTTSGFDIGSGCRDGTSVTLDARGAIYVMDDGGGTVAGVDVIKGGR
jgi:hypothetical protein